MTAGNWQHREPTTRMPDTLIEVCVDSVESALVAQAAGAGRVELCDNLVQGGTTPSAGMVGLCVERLEIPVHVMIRPRGGDFLYSHAEAEVMRRDIELARRLAAGGVVLGCLRADGSIDADLTRTLAEHARPLSVTVHRAFDLSRDPLEALAVLIDCGVDRVLTSGQRATAEEGIPVIRALVRAAARMTAPRNLKRQSTSSSGNVRKNTRPSS
jgi:copper homeostasis protein